MLKTARPIRSACTVISGRPLPEQQQGADKQAPTVSKCKYHFRKQNLNFNMVLFISLRTSLYDTEILENQLNEIIHMKNCYYPQRILYIYILLYNISKMTYLCYPKCMPVNTGCPVITGQLLFQYNGLYYLGPFCLRSFNLLKHIEKPMAIQTIDQYCSIYLSSFSIPSYLIHTFSFSAWLILLFILK